MAFFPLDFPIFSLSYPWTKTCSQGRGHVERMAHRDSCFGPSGLRFFNRHEVAIDNHRAKVYDAVSRLIALIFHG